VQCHPYVIIITTKIRAVSVPV